MKRNLSKTLGLIALVGSISSVNAVEVTGAGSTFVYPIISKWADTFKQKTKVNINYQSIGSGGGIKQIQSKTVNFGATDKPLTTEELKKDNLLQFPLINGGVVPVINMTEIADGALKLNGSVLADIYLGKVKKWNDAPIAALNPGIKLPDLAITVVHRADGSGTSFIWTNYLSKVSPDWKSKVGEGSAVNWPAGVAGKGNEGVASYVQRIKGAIGYVEYAYALQNKMNCAQMQNSSKNFVQANSESFIAAASSANWAKAENFYLILTDAPGAKSWPIAGSTFILMQKDQLKSEASKEALKFFKWALNEGQKSAEELHYVPFSKNVVALIEKSWKSSDGSAKADKGTVLSR